MRKISPEIENPFDNVLIDLADKLCPLLKKWNFTPNQLTTISLLLTVINLVLVWYGYYYWAAVFFLLSYFFDILDGHFARKYEMTTTFGDYYDHVTDFIANCGIFVLILYKLETKRERVLFVAIFAILLLTLSVQIGCQEKIHGKGQSASLKPLEALCPYPQEMIKYARYGGCGTYMLFIAAFLVYMGTKQSRKR